MSDDTTNGSSREFLLLETQMQRGARPPRAASSRCGYCGELLKEGECIFCPSHETSELPESPSDAAKFLGLRNKVPSP